MGWGGKQPLRAGARGDGGRRTKGRGGVGREAAYLECMVALKEHVLHLLLPLLLLTRNVLRCLQVSRAAYCAVRLRSSLGIRIPGVHSTLVLKGYMPPLLLVTRNVLRCLGKLV